MRLLILDTYASAVLLIALGIIIFFSLNFDPHLNSLLGILVILLGASLYLRQRSEAYHYILAVTIVVTGITAGAARVYLLDTPRLQDTIKEVWITGKIDEISLKEKDTKLLLGELQNKLPINRARISIKGDYTHFKIGDIISLRATLMPPPGPAIPSGFDYRLFSYFKGIGAIGYATTKPKIIRKNDANSFSQFIENSRLDIAKRIREVLKGSSAEIAVGMLVGDAGGINETDSETIRKSGIAHIIAISGMHIVIVVGIIFFTARFCLTKISWLTMRMDVKKIAALVAIIFSYFYLLIAGSPVSAQRAFMMSSFVLFGLVIDREITPIRSISVAAFIILLLMPESLISASLQMSFAACYSLIAFYNFLKHRKLSRYKIIDYAFKITLSTVVAGSATAPFVIYHFYQYSTYSVLTNIIAIPLSDFIIMPLLMAGLVTIPLKLDYLFFKLAGYSIDIMLHYARFVANLPFSSFYIPPLSKLALVIYGTSGYLLCTARIKYKIIPWVTMALSIGTLILFTKPDILISENAKIFAVNREESYFISSKIPARFIRHIWADYLGIDDFNNIKNIGCTEYFCEASDGVFITRGLELSATECAKAVLIINLSNTQVACSAKIWQIPTDLGNIFIWLENGLKIQGTEETNYQRKWK